MRAAEALLVRIFDYQAAKAKLDQLHDAASLLHGYYRDQSAQYIYVGEYGLALDTIADAYLSNSLRMPADLFLVFDDLATTMETYSDPEFGAVAELRRAQLNR